MKLSFFRLILLSVIFSIILNFEPVMLAEASSSKGECEHPGSFGNMCFVCGQKLEETGVSFRYIHKVCQFIQLPYKFQNNFPFLSQVLVFINELWEICFLRK